MRSQISRIVAWTSSAIVVSFLIPLCLLVRVLAENRGMAAADEEARTIAILVSTLSDDPNLAALITPADARFAGPTSVLMPNGAVLGASAPNLANDPEVKRATGGEAFTVVDDQGGRVLVPVIMEKGTAVVRTTAPPDLLYEGVFPAWLSIIALGLTLIIISLIVARQAGTRISRPLREVAATAHELRAGDLSARANVRGPAETIELAAALNGLADRIGELLVNERAAVGDLAHRLRTPVTALRLDTESVDDPEVAARLQAKLEELQRAIDAIVKDARRPLREDLAPGCDATTTVRDRLAFWEPLAEDQGRQLDISLPTVALPVRMGALDLCDVVDILIDNVFAHTDEQVPMAVTLSSEAAMAVLRVADGGPGFPPLGQVQDERVGSTGLGLDIVQRAVLAQGGSVVRSAPGSKGAVVLSLIHI